MYLMFLMFFTSLAKMNPKLLFQTILRIALSATLKELIVYYVRLSRLSV